MFQETDIVVLKCDVPEYGLKEGDIGAVVHCYRDAAAFEVEFVTAQKRHRGPLNSQPRGHQTG